MADQGLNDQLIEKQNIREVLRAKVIEYLKRKGIKFEFESDEMSGPFILKEIDGTATNIELTGIGAYSFLDDTLMCFEDNESSIYSFLRAIERLIDHIRKTGISNNINTTYFFHIAIIKQTHAHVWTFSVYNKY
jgi:hypothetical protein